MLTIHLRLLDLPVPLALGLAGDFFFVEPLGLPRPLFAGEEPSASPSSAALASYKNDTGQMGTRMGRKLPFLPSSWALAFPFRLSRFFRRWLCVHAWLVRRRQTFSVFRREINNHEPTETKTQRSETSKQRAKQTPRAPFTK